MEGGDTSLPTFRQGLLILGTPVGHDDFVKEQLRSRWEKHDVLLQRIPAVPNLQAAWLLLTFCAAARAYFTLRTVRPALVEEFAASHNHAIWTCLVEILGIDGSAVSEAAKKAVTLPLSTGGLGIQICHEGAPGCTVGQLGRCSGDDSQTSSQGCGRDHHCPRSRPQLSVNHSCPGFQGVAGSGRFRDAKLGGVGAGRKTESTKPRGGDCGHSGKPRMAAASISGVGEEQSRRIAAPTHGTRTSSDVVPRRPHGSRNVLQFPNEWGDTFRFPTFSPPPLAPSPSSLASYYLPLPMWPSRGRLWPSSRSVRHSRSAGEAWVCIGVSRRKGLPRGRGKSEDERACAGTRPPPRPEPSRRSAIGSGGGRFGALQRGPTGSGHHFGLSTPCRRDRFSEGSNSGWRSPQKSQGTEGENLPRTRWRRRTRQIGGPCCRSGWTLVKRSFPVRGFFGMGQSAECSGVHPNPSGTRMESEMEETFGMHSSKDVREHVAGARVANHCRIHNTLRG